MRKKTPVGEVAIISENLLKDKIYTIRGVKVMLDADLAELVNKNASLKTVSSS